MSLTLPALKVEIGFGGAGNTPYLLFDDPTRGKFDTGEFASGVTFTDVTADASDVQIDRGRSRPLEDYNAGRCTIVLDNTSGDYDPNNLSGTYVSAGVTQVLPMVPIRVRAEIGGVTYDRFYGFVDRWEQSQRGQTATTTVTATDGLKVLASYDPGGATGATGAGEDTGARVARILDMVSIPDGDRDLDVGDSTLQATTLEGAALTQIRDAVKSEQGYFYFSADGKYTFRNRTSRYGNFVTTDEEVGADLAQRGPDALFSNILPNDTAVSYAGGIIAGYEQVAPKYDDELIKNSVNATNMGGTLQQTASSASIAKYLTKSYSESSLWLQTDGEALNWANQILVQFKDADQRFDSLDVLPGVLWSTSRWQTMLGLEFGDLIQIDYRPVAGDDMTVISFLDGITEKITNGTDWKITYRFTPTTAYGNAIVFYDIDGAGSPPGFDEFQFTF